MNIKDWVQQYRQLLRMEEKVQGEQWDSSKKSVKELRQEGVIIYPLKLLKWKYNHSNAIILTLKFSTFQENNHSNFTHGTPILIYSASTEDQQCLALMISYSENECEIQLFNDVIPEWINENDIGLKRLPDSKTFQAMHGVLERIEREEHSTIAHLFSIILGITSQNESIKSENIDCCYPNLNSSQNKALQNSLINVPLQLIHGPPGTGKTTTLVTLIKHLKNNNNRIIAAAPSHAAIDHLAGLLIRQGVKVLRLGHSLKIHPDIFPYTTEGILGQPQAQKALKQLRIQIEEQFKKAQQFKRNFGTEERKERKIAYQTAREIKKEIEATVHYLLDKEIDKADVVLGTPIGLQSPLLNNKKFDVALLDEAGQCLLPLGLLVAEKAHQLVLVGDHFQIPPTVISSQAEKKGLGISILEKAIRNNKNHSFLSTQYRMPPEISNFSSQYFYGNRLTSVPNSIPNALLFYDTAGAGFLEKKDEDSTSIANLDEIDVVRNYLLKNIEPSSALFISPYAGQVAQAKLAFPQIKSSTIDSFQGQEVDYLILSLVRSNSDGKIGFLKDYRRMNVALTRAKKQLIVIGDSTTLAKDAFYQAFVKYTESIGGYHSVFELMYE